MRTTQAAEEPKKKDSPVRKVKDTAGICPENWYLALPSNRIFAGSNDGSLESFDLYDTNGNPAGSTAFYPDVGEEFGYLPKGELYHYMLDRVEYLQDTATAQILADVETEKGALAAGTEHYGILTFEDGSLRIFNKDGTECAARQYPGLIIPGGEEEKTVYLRSVFIRCAETEDAVIFSLGISGKPEAACRVLMKEDGTCTDSTQETFPEGLKNGTLIPFGKFLLCETDNACDVYTPDGLLVMKGAKEGYTSALKRAFPRSALIRNRWDRELSPDYLILADDRRWMAFDPSLENVDSGPVREGECCREGTDKKLPWAPLCPELGGISDGTVSFCCEREIPWVRKDGGYLLWTGEKLLFLALPETETLLQINDTFVYTSEKPETVDGVKPERLYHLRPLEDLTKDVMPEGENAEPARMYLQKGSFLITRSYDSAERVSRVYDADRNLLFSTTGTIIPVVMGNYYLKRGPYQGIVGKDGGWILRTYRVTE